MIKMKRKQDKTKMELELLYDTIKNMDPASDDYAKIVDQISKLEEISAAKRNRPSADGVISAVASVGSLLLVLNAEEIGRKILSSRAFNFIRKVR